MPEIAVAANVAAAGKPAPAATGNSAASPGSNDQSGSPEPFAAVLQQHMDGAAPDQAAATNAANTTTATDPAPAPGNLAAMLPMLMGNGALSGNAPGEPALPGMAKKTGNSNAEDSSATTTPIIALPTMVPMTIVTPAESNAGTSNTASADSPAPPLTANLAAAPDIATATPKQGVKSDDTFDALLADNRNVGATGQANTQIHAAGSAVAASGTSSHVVDSAVGSHAWDSEIGNRMVWMANNHSSRAELVLTPPQMGKIEISVTMSGDKATATFVSANPEVRDAITNAVPRLREILADAGVTLGQTQVGSEAPKQWANDSQNRDNSFRGAATVALGNASGILVSTAGPAAWAGAGRGLVDTFA